MAQTPGTQIQSVRRAMRLLLWAGSRSAGCTAKHAADAQGLALPTAYHLLTTLVSEGLLVKDSRRVYHLGPQVGALAWAYDQQAQPPEHLTSPLDDLVGMTAETAHVAAWRGHEIQLLRTCHGGNTLLGRQPPAGLYRNAHARAVGKVLLAFAPPTLRDAYLAEYRFVRLTAATITDESGLATELDTIRARGYALDLGEFSEELRCVAAPVLFGDFLIAAYGVSAPPERFAASQGQITRVVRKVAAAVGRALRPTEAAIRT